MTPFEDRLNRIGATRLRGMRRGLEKESLRSLPDGTLALTPHPGALGSPLTHGRITTDYSESQVELITGAHRDVQAALDELTQVHQYVYRALAEDCNCAGDERLWVASMPSRLPTDETIPLGRYGSSNIGRAKSVYRMGLGHRYGRRMQTISGIHYNWSLPGLSNDEHFALIRNFRRHAFVLLWLFGASPAVCGSFVAGREHGLQSLGAGAPGVVSGSAGSLGLRDPANGSLGLRDAANGSLGLPCATSLRMGRLGYQSAAQATLAVSYNSLEGYAASLHEALTRPYAAYEKIGVRNLGGEYNQLATTLLQIENEFYGTIRPKRVIRPGERPLHALRERGVEYIEVRCMDLDPYVPVGIQAATMRFIDIFLLHCLLQDSPPDTPQEIADLGDNQHRTAAYGRQPGLTLKRDGQDVQLVDWVAEILSACAPIATALDAALGGGDYWEALNAARACLAAPDSLPSARVLAAMSQDFGGSHIAFTRAQAEQTRLHFQALPWTSEQQAVFEAEAQASVAAQRAIEAADSVDFETFRQTYVSAEGLQARPALQPA
jgi:glutamate--cysteine ligase